MAAGLTVNDERAGCLVFVLETGHFASILAAELDGRLDDLQGPVASVRVVRDAVLQIETALERAVVLRPLARNPLVHGHRQVTQEPLHYQALLLVIGHDVIAVQNDRSAAILHGWRHVDRRDSHRHSSCCHKHSNINHHIFLANHLHKSKTTAIIR